MPAPTAADPNAAATIQALTAQLNALSARLAVLENGPVLFTQSSAVPAPTPVIIQKPGNSNTS